jgi:hypothetical protein
MTILGLLDFSNGIVWFVRSVDGCQTGLFFFLGKEKIGPSGNKILDEQTSGYRWKPLNKFRSRGSKKPNAQFWDYSFT